jgi:methyl acetate hydrolase
MTWPEPLVASVRSTRRFRSIAMLILPAVFGAVMLDGLGAASPDRPSIAPAGRDALSRFLSDAVARGDVPGVVAVVVGKDGVLYQGAAGKLDVARGMAMPVDAIFRIASMTKPVTTVAAMMLVEAGTLGLDDPVSKYLPDFKNRQVLVSPDASAGHDATRGPTREMTIRHLMSHTSGIGYAWSSPVVARLVAGDRDKEPAIPLLHDPGARWTYGASTRVLGQIVEKLSGQPLDAFFNARILGPLKMADTAYAVPAQKLARVATVHTRATGTIVERPNAATQQAPVRGDGGLYSTARDYGVFLQMLLNGGSLGGATLLRPSSVTMMGQNQIGTVAVEEQPAADPTLTRPYPLGAGRDKFGLGFQIAAVDPRYAALRSPGSLSWAGLNNTHFWIDPTRHIAAVFFVQVLPFYDEASIRTLRGFEGLVYQSLQ